MDWLQEIAKDKALPQTLSKFLTTYGQIGFGSSIAAIYRQATELYM